MSEKLEPKDGEKLCPKCKNIVKDSEFNHYFGICHECEEGTGTGH